MEKKKQTQRDRMRDLYVKGMPIDGIAEMFDLKPRTIYYHRGQDKEAGLDWDELRLQRNLGDGQFDEHNKLFLSQLFHCFEEEQSKLAEIESARERLEIIERYANSYHKLVCAARRTEPLAEVHEIAASVIDVLSKLAAQDAREDIVDWLLSRLGDIQDAIRKQFSKAA